MTAGADNQTRFDALVSDGEQRLAAHDWTGALEAFSQAAAVNGDHPAVVAGRAQALRNLGDHAQARELADRGLADWPDDVRLLIENALLEAHEEPERAVELLERAARLSPDSEQVAVELEAARLRTAWEHYGANDYERAADLFGRAAAGNSESAEAARGLISSLRLGGRIEEAAELAEEATARFAGDAALLVEAGWVRLAQDRAEPALRSFEQALDLAPWDEFGNRGRLRALRLLGRLEDAEQALEEARSRGAASVDVLMEVGQLRYDKADYAGAAALFDEALALDGGERAEELVRWKLQSLRIGGLLEAADAVATEAAARFEGSAEVLSERAWLELDHGRNEEALDLADRALAADPAYEFAHRGKLRALRLTQRWVAAERALETALAALPNEASLVTEGAWLQVDQGRYDRALERFERALELDPGRSWAHRGKISSLRMLARYPEAHAAAAAALGILPDDGSILAEDGWALVDEGRHADAAATFDRAVAKDDSEYAYEGWIYALTALGRLDDAERRAGEAQTRFPENARILVRRAEVAIASSAFDIAARLLLEAEQLDPDLPLAQTRRLELLFRLKRVQEARDLMDRLRERFPDDRSVREDLGFAYLQRNEYDRAAAEFRAILDQDPAALEGLNGLAALAERTGDYAEAESRFRELRKLHPDHPVLITNLAWTLVRPRDPRKLDEAEELANERLRLGKDSTAHGILGVIAFRRGLLLEAEEHLRASIDLSEGEGNYVDLGALYVKMGRYEEARTMLEEALGREPNNVRAHVELGGLALEEDRLQDALREFRTALACDPTNEEPPAALAVALVNAGRSAEAERVLRQALRTVDEPRRGRLHMTLAWVLERLGADTGEEEHYERALKEVAYAIRIDRDRPEVQFQAGTLRARVGELRGALRHFERCFELDPDNFEAERYAERLRKEIRKDRTVTQAGLVAGVVVGSAAGAQLALLWIFFLLERVSGTMLATTIPVLLGLLVLAFVLPRVIEFSFGGVRAVLTAPAPAIARGPSGELNIVSAQPAIGTGSRG